MGKLTQQIREYISSPQVDGNEHYGKWGALRKDQRLLIAYLCEYCDLQEKYADTFFKETQALKHQLAEKDKEIERLKSCVMSKEQVETIVKEKIDTIKEMAIREATPIMIKEIRHQVCEEIRDFVDNYPIKKISFDFCNDIEKKLHQIEQGESK